MKRLFFIVLVVLLSWSGVKAQDFSVHERFGILLDLGVVYPQTNSSFPLPFFGLQLGVEVDTGEWQFGVRATISDLLIVLNNLSFDVYVRYSALAEFNVYFGLGYRWNILLLPGNSTFTDWHGLLGIEFPSHFFIELTPGISNGTVYYYGPMPAPTSQTRTTPYSSKEDVTRFILIVSLGWNWRF